MAIGNGDDQTDSELFQRRAIPPIPGITGNGRGEPQLMSYVVTDEVLDDESKEKEAEEEAELEKEIMVC